jgi:hypothetical protein
MNNPVIENAHKISDYLAELSESYNRLNMEQTAESKRAFLQLIQKIQKEAGNIVKSCKTILDTCYEPKIKIQMSKGLERIETLSQQLKIIAAVKTAAPLDKDKDQQLITCAKNIVKSLKQSIQDSQLASLLPKKDANLEIVTFKRNFYQLKQK